MRTPYIRKDHILIVILVRPKAEDPALPNPNFYPVESVRENGSCFDC